MITHAIACNQRQPQRQQRATESMHTQVIAGDTGQAKGSDGHRRQATASNGKRNQSAVGNKPRQPFATHGKQLQSAATGKREQRAAPRQSDATAGNAVQSIARAGNRRQDLSPQSRSALPSWMLDRENCGCCHHSYRKCEHSSSFGPDTAVVKET